MKCMCCGGTMERRSAPFYIDRKHVHVRLDSVPAWVCSQCGEAHFEEAEVEAVQHIIKSLDEQTGKLARTA